MIGYLLKVIACSGLLYAFYYCFLQKEKMLVFNRCYLLACMIVPLLLPLIKMDATLPEHLGVSTRQFEELYAAIDAPVQPAPVVSGSSATTTGMAGEAIAGAVLFFGVSFLLMIRFVRNLLHYQRLHRYYPKIKEDGFSIVLLEAAVSPHSFMRTIFLNCVEYERGLIDPDILLHERAHIKQVHSLDILFAELLTIVFWWNPFLFLFKNAIRMNHEFLADADVIQHTGNRSRYQELMLKMVSLNAQAPLSSNFYLVTKKRLIMLYKKTSTAAKHIKGAVALFIFLPLLLIFAGGANGRNLKWNAYTNFDMGAMITGYAGKHILPAASAVRRDGLIGNNPEKDRSPELVIDRLKTEMVPAMVQVSERKDSAVLRPAQLSVVRLPVAVDSAEVPYRSYPVHSGLSEEKMVEFGKFVEKYVMEDKGKKVLWYGQMLRPVLDLYFGMTDEQRETVNEKLPEVFLAANSGGLVQVNEKYKNDDRRIIVVYPDGKHVTASVATDEDRNRFLERLGLDLRKKQTSDYASRTYVYHGKPVAGFTMFYMAKNQAAQVR
ncbi:MAG: M56 family metallopeptidase [Niabella sp.]|nr:M56 family metallopeptidase [Niabella sp.]